jgi:hypothetical protein
LRQNEIGFRVDFFRRKPGLKQSRLAVGMLLLFWGGVWIGACAPAIQPGTEKNEPAQTNSFSPTNQETSLPSPEIQKTYLALTAPYPMPGSTPFPDALLAYPAMKETEAAQELTAAAWPTITPFPPTATITSTPTRFPLAEPLPAPIYFINSSQGLNPPPRQIWRMERDGYTLTEITHEKEGVRGFDISNLGKLVYIYHNNLIVTDSLGHNPQIVLKGKEPPPLEEQYPWYFDKEAIRKPVWSPDGRKIAYYRDGLHVLDLTSGSIIQVMEGRKMVPGLNLTPVPENERAPLYLPYAWTPDGSLIVVLIMGYERGATGFVPPVENGALIQVDIPSGGCCDFSFTQDMKMLFSAGDHTTVGLWLVDPKTGKGQRLTAELKNDYASNPIVNSPKRAPDGRIYFFTTSAGTPLAEWQSRLAYVDEGKAPFRIPEDVTFIDTGQEYTGVLWAPDASIVLVQDYFQDLAMITLKDGKVHPFRLQVDTLEWGR